MKTRIFAKKLASALSPLAILVLLAFAPISRAADIIPDPSNNVAVADTQIPSDVSNVKAVGGDGTVNLTWDVATDNVGVKGYKVYYGAQSVSVAPNNQYQFGPIDVGNKITFSVPGLQNGTRYYFGVTAYDAQANESDSYSTEVAATPGHGSADTQAPKVAKAQAVTKTQVRVTFSEPIQLPAKNPESAFSIKSDPAGVQLKVSAAAIDVTDKTNMSVLLTTDLQKAGTGYILTAGINIKDIAGNPIVSGTSDTAPFTGTDLEIATQQMTQQNVNSLQLLTATATDATHVVVVFSEPVVLDKTDPLKNFIVTEEQNIENLLDIAKVELDGTKTMVTLTSAVQKSVQYTLLAVDVADAKGKKIDVTQSALTFMGVAGVPVTEQTSQQTQQGTQQMDLTPPEDATNLAAAMLKKMIVTLTWGPSLNSANDLANYVLYLSKDGTTYGKGMMIDPKTLTFDITDLMPKVKYFFKLAARDATGNESKGAVTTFVLPGTGPELAVFALGSLLAGKLVKRRKNRRNIGKISKK